MSLLKIRITWVFLIHYLIHKFFKWILTEFMYGHCQKWEWRTDTISAPNMLTGYGSTFDLDWRGEGSPGEKYLSWQAWDLWLQISLLTVCSLSFKNKYIVKRNNYRTENIFPKHTDPHPVSRFIGLIEDQICRLYLFIMTEYIGIDKAWGAKQWDFFCSKFDSYIEIKQWLSALTENY